jgi:MscS family membrane protein
MVHSTRRLAAPLVFLALGGLATGARAQPPAQPSAPPAASPTPAASPEPAAEAPESPRASVRAFVDLTARRGDYARAARYLVLPPGEEARGPELAWRLRAVIERRLDVDLDTVSPAAEGNVQDGLPAGIDTIGQVPDASGGSDSVFLVRTRDAAGAYWAFSRQTVARVDGWYDALPDRWVRDWMPEQLQRYGPFDLMWWQWLAMPVLLVVALAAGRLLGAATRGVLHRLTSRTATQWDDRLLDRVAPALTLAWAAAVAALLLPRLGLLPAAHAYLRSVLGGLATFAVVWSLWRAVDVWAQFLMERPWAVDNASARSLVSLTRNLAKVFVAVGGAVATLAAFGYPVATVLAGLGIGGLALAFGAQKTIENLFGSISIAADQPFRVGDFVKIEDFSGHVERIGMRSTQVRTLDRTLITLPNGRLADMRVEDFASRDRIRFTATVSLAYGTSEAQVRQVVSGIDQLLRADPSTWPEGVVAKLASLGPSALEVEVVCWFRTTDFDEFRELRQRTLLGILRIVEEAGTSLAFPTRTVHVVSGPPSRAADGLPPAG